MEISVFGYQTKLGAGKIWASFQKIIIIDLEIYMLALTLISVIAEEIVINDEGRKIRKKISPFLLER